MMVVFGLEFVGNIGSFIQKEVKGKTLSNVLLQPMSVREFMFLKIKAAFFTSIVSFSLMIILLILNFNLVIEFVKKVRIPGLMAILSGIIMFYTIAMVSAIAYRKERTFLEQIKGALGVKIIGNNLEKVMAGTPVLVSWLGSCAQEMFNCFLSNRVIS